MDLIAEYINQNWDAFLTFLVESYGIPVDEVEETAEKYLDEIKPKIMGMEKDRSKKNKGGLNEN